MRTHIMLPWTAHPYTIAAVFPLICPNCRSPLQADTPERLRCPEESFLFDRVHGIWRMFTLEQQTTYARFIREYTEIRRREGRGSPDLAYYRALPFRDLTGRHRRDWKIRARSFVTFCKRVLTPLERRVQRPLRIFDLGAGNGWLAYRLACRGHFVAAVDIQTDDWDGLGAHRHYDVPFLSVQADFLRLPFAPATADLAIYNASFHYATDYGTALTEAFRVLRRDGCVVIMDTPLYRSRASGLAMVREREDRFRRLYGFPSNALSCENFLTADRLHALAEQLGIRWQCIFPFYGIRWALRPWKARILGHREPARFAIFVGRRAHTPPRPHIHHGAPAG